MLKLEDHKVYQRITCNNTLESQLAVGEAVNIILDLLANCAPVDIIPNQSVIRRADAFCKTHERERHEYELTAKFLEDQQRQKDRILNAFVNS